MFILSLSSCKCIFSLLIKLDNAIGSDRLVVCAVVSCEGFKTTMVVSLAGLAVSPVSNNILVIHPNPVCLTKSSC